MSFNRELYNKITDAWTYILGDNLHYGYFSSDQLSLSEATNKLIDKLASLTVINATTTIIDVGCGVGEPAFYLHKQYGAKITGISISERGVELANRKAADKGYADSVKFLVADALDSGLACGIFDVAWIMESSHLMRGKDRLFTETHRVLKNKGTILLCDLVLKHELTLSDVLKKKVEFEVLERQFGKVKMETVIRYMSLLGHCGFTDMESIDISTEVVPTLFCWKHNAIENREVIIKHLGQSHYEEFLASCDILHNFFTTGILGYTMLKAVKP